MITRICAGLALSLLILLRPGTAQENADTTQAVEEEKEDKKWEVNASHGPSRDVEFVTDEGTWISVDVSPNGNTIVFDLLGDIYTMPVSGGEATLLLGGAAYETQPRYSPDGSSIVFTSDRDGCDNIWIMNADGEDLRAVTEEKERQTSNPIWTPDGQFIIARKHFRNTRSLGAGEMWLYHSTGGGGIRLTERRNWQQNACDPALSPDGRYLYYDEDVSSGGRYEYNRDPYGVIYVVQRLDRETGKTETFVRANGGAVKPMVSPDGKYLSFIRRVRLKSVLYLRNLTTGEEWPLYDGLSRDHQETWSIFGLYPNYDWTPDGSSIIISAHGKIISIDVASGNTTPIPFNATVRQTVTEPVLFKQEVSPDTFGVRMLRWVTTSPDEDQVVYNALGHLYVRDLPDGTPERLTDDDHFEFYPSFSSDGDWIVYTTWDDQQRGAVYKVRSSGGSGKKLTSITGSYSEPSFSRDGKSIVFRKLSGDLMRGQSFGSEPGVYMMSSDGGDADLVTESGYTPRFNKSGDRILLNDYEGDGLALVSVNLTGGDRRVHLTTANGQDITVSPDEQWVFFSERHNSYVAALPISGQPVNIGPTTSDIPVKRVTRDWGLYPHWSGDSRTVYWSLGPELYSKRLNETFTFAEGAPDSLSDEPDTSGIYISFTANTDKPSGIIAITGARVITMNGDEILTDATIVIDGNRITSVGESASVPDGAHVIDASGKFVMPGMIDVHAHGPAGSAGMTPQQNWAFYAAVAFGVTTEHDPSNDTETIFAASELIKAGGVIGPRLYSTGTILYGGEGSYRVVMNSLDDARSHLRRLKAVGAFSVKSYNQPRRDTRQQVIKAARELEMMVYPEGGSTFYWNMTHILDGHTGIEHSVPVAPLYRDVVTLYANSGVGYTPTLVVSYGGLMGENYWYMHTNVWENERLLTFVPRGLVDGRSRRRMMVNDDDWNHIYVSQGVNAVVEAGGRAQLGAHGQMQGLGAHWELWSLVQGGMTPMNALRCATIFGAEYIGMADDIGSIEKGKLADLIILDKNPLDDIRNSESIQYVMVNGRLFDSTTMNEVGNHPRERKPFYWEQGTDPGTMSLEAVHGTIEDYWDGVCSCGN